MPLLFTFYRFFPPSPSPYPQYFSWFPFNSLTQVFLGPFIPAITYDPSSSIHIVFSSSITPFVLPYFNPFTLAFSSAWLAEVESTSFSTNLVIDKQPQQFPFRANNVFSVIQELPWHVPTSRTRFPA